MTSIFFLLTFIVSWAFWFAAAQSPRPSIVLLYLGIFGPAIVAVTMTLRAEGMAGTRALLSRLFRWRVGPQWYLVAIAFMLVVKLTMAVVHRVALGVWPQFGQTPVLGMLAVAIFSAITLSQSGEELGWRGFALPRLASRMGLGWASVVLGVVWAAWHLPLFFLFPTADTFGQSFPAYLAQVTALSVAIAWLWWRTDGSLLLTMLMHAAINNTKDIVPSVAISARSVWTLDASQTSWMTAAVLWAFAAAMLLDMRKFRRDA